ncbi:MAG: aldehyde dehydrogenase family protein [Pirellulaceae bacterium]|nr:aldehyde dehydrogenase family protein [Pirellulaceae bacterium]
MIELSPLRWGRPYESLETIDVSHFATGEPIAKIGTVNGGIVTRDLRQADKAREVLRQFSIDDLIERAGRAAELFESATLAVGSGAQSPDDFVLQQSASTGLPEHMCRSNMQKNAFVLKNMRQILDALTRGLDLNILSRGYGKESRDVIVSFQAQAGALGAVLPNNSPGVHTLWMPVVPLQIGLALKPGSQEPWTAYRITAAFAEAGIPPECISLYPGGHDVGQAILGGCQRSMIFGSLQTVAQYAGNPKVQVHGPGFSKIFLGDDCVDRWPDFLDVMVESILSNGGRSCINASNVFASRHTREIAEALAERLGPVEPLPPNDPQAALAAFTTPGMGAAVWKMLESDLNEAGVEHLTESYGPRLVEHERYAFLRPMIVHADSPDRGIVSKEFMFPFASVVACPQAEMIKRSGYTLVGTAITENEHWIQQLADATSIDRLNVGPIPTNRLNWLQPHEGNLIDFLFRSRALQVAAPHPALANV